MSSTAKRTISLPREHAKFIDRQVASGAYASASVVVRAGLRALLDRVTAIESWLREEVASAYDAMKANPARGIPARDVFAEIKTRHARAHKTRRREKA